MVVVVVMLLLLYLFDVDKTFPPFFSYASLNDDVLLL